MTRDPDRGRHRWFPRRSVAERQAWAVAHPWRSGCWFGLFMFVLFMIQAMERTVLWKSAALGAGFSVLGVLLIVPLFKLATRRRWVERPGADNYAPPTGRRMWTRVSDRSLRGAMLLGSFCIVVMIADLATSTDHRVRSTIALACGVWIVATAWAERRARRRGG